MEGKELRRIIQSQVPVDIADAIKSFDAFRPVGYTLRRLYGSVNDLNKEMPNAPVFAAFIDNELNEALKDPNSKCGDWLRSFLVSKRVESLFESKEIDKIEFSLWKLEKGLFTKQQEVYNDETPGEHLVICGRRSGKTILDSRLLVRKLLRPGGKALYLNKTFKNAIKQMYDEVYDLGESLGLQYEEGTSKSEGFIIVPNGSSIQFGGINNIDEIDKYRGFKYNLIIIDEISHLRHQEYLTEQVLAPSTMDYPNAQIFYTGTPPRIRNYVNKLWKSNIPKYHWTARDNPHIDDFDGFVKRVCQKRKCTIDEPFIQREYFGNMEAFDTAALVYNPDTTPREIKPDRIIMGVDFGFEDDNAIITLAINDKEKRGVVIKEFKKNHIGALALMDATNDEFQFALNYLKQFYSEELAKTKIDIVTDTNEPMIAEDMRNVYKLPVLKAYKYDKEFSIHSLSDALRMGLCSIPRNGVCHEECQNTVWQRDEESDSIIYKIDDSVYHPNAIEALRYAWRQATLYWEDKEEERQEETPARLLTLPKEFLPKQLQEEKEEVLII